MNLLLCAATSFEIEPLVQFIRSENIQGVDVLITGVGSTATTYALTKAVLTKKPDFILQAGVAGCINKHLPLTKVVIVENEMLGDLGVEENGTFHSVFDMNLVDKSVYPWKNGKLSNDVEPLRKTGMTIVDAVTVNEISTDEKRIEFYRTQLGAQIESMEGAALHYVALSEKIPFLQIRALSNFVGERDKNKWVMDVAIANLNLELQRIFLNILKK
jgi:futalosine hydrolase